MLAMRTRDGFAQQAIKRTIYGDNQQLLLFVRTGQEDLSWKKGQGRPSRIFITISSGSFVYSKFVSHDRESNKDVKGPNWGARLKEIRSSSLVPCPSSNLPKDLFW
jgi:hypothetical protein